MSTWCACCRSAVPLRRPWCSTGRRSRSAASARSPVRSRSPTPRCRASTRRSRRILGGWAIIDHGSRNGTFVDGARIEHAQLARRRGDPRRQDADRPRRGRCSAPTSGSRARRPTAPLIGSQRRDCCASTARSRWSRPRRCRCWSLGETGVGKELVAEEIHRRSAARVARSSRSTARRSRPSSPRASCSVTWRARSPAPPARPTACSSPPTAARCSSTRSASCRSTLQAKLLRALAKGEIRAVGRRPSRAVDVRVDRRDPARPRRAVAARRFRADLLNRLSGWQRHGPAAARRAATTSSRSPPAPRAAPRRRRCRPTPPRRWCSTTGRATCASSSACSPQR